MSFTILPGQFSRRGEFYYQLAQLSTTGIGLPQAVDLLLAHPPAGSYRLPLRHLRAHLAAGEGFADSLARLGNWTPPFDIALIRAGEQSGRLDTVFKLLAEYYRERAVLLRRTYSDLAYPVFLFHFAMALFPFVAWFQNGDTLGFLRQTLGLFLPLYAVVFALVYAGQGARGAAWRATLEGLLHPLPVLGSARRSLALARLSMALDALLNAGVGIIEAWELAAAASGSPALVRTVGGWRPHLLAGESPSAQVSSSRAFPPVFASLYHTGEISGQLEDTLRRLYAYYQEEGTRKLRQITTAGPRIVYFGVALLVAVKVIGFYAGRMLELNQVINQL